MYPVSTIQDRPPKVTTYDKLLLKVSSFKFVETTETCTHCGRAEL